ncbi:MAG: 50S ribosomal protein L18a [Thermoplasmata archaeon]|uniref:Large ribosomal subunit protein eL20 n=1 Tax=Candidatus Sysuiplasma superficiale TaxID=2823368 RepID=A0A8J7YQ96_9ARCH|nr:50S ribosomal protein L18a [Candidatus Sysuiplasma superficiale]MBX8643366.1 50S ribosomal protein L18a [Candidatus Sysuiplasma superficiale]MCL4347102.1 50S ribosomal protein L18Ae [Candidatus Thermoplasmatota archaeon]
MKAYMVTGKFKVSDRQWQSFNIEVASASEDGAAEKIRTLLGSRHRVPRRLITIERIAELEEGSIEDNVVKYQVGAKA